MPFGGFSVDGRHGPYIQQIANQKPDKPAASSPSGSGMGLAEEAANKGEYQTARLRMPQTSARLEAFIAALQAKWPYGTPGHVTVYLAGLPDYGAHALPDSSIVIPVGLLMRVKSDDELAFVLGHELSHIRLNHFAAAEAAIARRRAFDQLAQAAVVGASLSQTRMSVSGGQMTITQNKSAIDKATGQAEAANEAMHLLLLFGDDAFSRNQEDQADSLGFDFTNLTNYSADAAAATVFENLVADGDRRAAVASAMQLQLKQTAAVLLDATNQQKLMNGQADDVAHTLKANFEQGLRDKALNFLMTMGQKHRSPPERKKGISTYSDAAYPDGLPLRDLQTSWLDKTRASKEYVQAVVVVNAVQVSLQKRAAGDPDAALAEVGKAMKTQFKASPLVSNEAARVYADKHQVDQADKLYTIADLSGDQTLDGYIDHADLLIRAGRYEAARKVIEGAVRRLAPPPLPAPMTASDGARMRDPGDKSFLPQLITISFKTGKEDEGLRYLDRCVAYDDNDELIRQCIYSALDPGGVEYDKLPPERRETIDRLVRQRAAKQKARNPLGDLTKIKLPGLPASH